MGYGAQEAVADEERPRSDSAEIPAPPARLARRAYLPARPSAALVLVALAGTACVVAGPWRPRTTATAMAAAGALEPAQRAAAVRAASGAVTVGCSETMATYCSLKAAASFEGAVVSVAYAVAGTSDTLWAPAQTYASEAEWEVPLYRLRTDADYDYALYAAASLDATPAKISEGVFTVPASGTSWIDGTPRATVEGDYSAPVLFFAMEDMKDYDDQMFEGLVAVDSEGYVVWYQEMGGQVLGFDQFPESYDMVMQYFPGDDTSTGLAVKSAAGESVGDAFYVACQGNGDDFVQVNHEARIASDGSGVITLYETVTETPTGVYIAELGMDNLTHYIYDQVALWDSTSNTMTTETNLMDHWDPVHLSGIRKPKSMTVEVTTCHSESGDGVNEQVGVLDWMHPSSVSDYGDLYVVALRNLDAVVAVSKTTGEVAWTLSSNDRMGSDFTFEREEDKFYDPHDAQLIADDELILIDDGNNRPNCVKGTDGFSQNCYTRAMHFKLDFETGKATVLWHFEYNVQPDGANFQDIKSQDLYVSDGGSVRVFDGSYVVAFTMTRPDSQFAHEGYVFVVNGDGEATATVRVPRRAWDAFPSGMYRAVPFATLGGEFADSPFSALRR